MWPTLVWRSVPTVLSVTRAYQILRIGTGNRSTVVLIFSILKQLLVSCHDIVMGKSASQAGLKSTNTAAAACVLTLLAEGMRMQLVVRAWHRVTGHAQAHR